MAERRRTARALGLVEVATVSDPGQERDLNEDASLVEPPQSPSARARGVLCVVADGMGGHAAGEVASRLAVQTIRARYYHGTSPYVAQSLREAIQQANLAIWKESRQSASRAGMGCTVAAAVLHQDSLVIGHVGDSRAYLIRGDAIAQLTTDHSFVAEQVAAGVLTEEQAQNHPHRNVITRALGSASTVEVDVTQQSVLPGDVLVLCSDGLMAANVTDSEIGFLARQQSPQQAAQTLVRLANQRGAPDNVTVAVLRIGEEGKQGSLLAELKRPVVIGVIAGLLIGALGLTMAPGFLGVGSTATPVATQSPVTTTISGSEAPFGASPTPTPAANRTAAATVTPAATRSPSAAATPAVAGKATSTATPAAANCTVNDPSLLVRVSTSSGASGALRDRPAMDSRYILLPNGTELRALQTCPGEADPASGEGFWYYARVIGAGPGAADEGFVNFSIVVTEPSISDGPIDKTPVAPTQTPVKPPAKTRTPTRTPTPAH